MIGGAILPSLLHQDPRYFYQGSGTKKSRALHALRTYSSPEETTGARSRTIPVSAVTWLPPHFPMPIIPRRIKAPDWCLRILPSIPRCTRAFDCSRNSLFVLPREPWCARRKAPVRLK